MNLRFPTAFLLVLIVISGSTVYGQSFDRDRPVGDGPANAKQIAPSLRIAPDGTAYAIWIDFRHGADGQIFIARSTDRGESFSTGRRVTNASGVLAGMQRGAQLAVDRGGVLHMTWQEFNSNQKISARYARSTDGGVTFSTPIAVAADSGLHHQDFPSIAVDSSGNPFLAWIDSREQDNGSSRNTQLYVVRSRDGGLTFEQPVRATYMPRGEGGTCECCNTSIAISRTGNVFVSFRSNINNDRDIYIARSLDGGSTFRSIKAATETWRLNACPMTGSSIVVDRDETAHVVWRDSRPSSQGKDFVYYTSLRLADTVCAPDRKISTTAGRSNYPSLGLTPGGDLLCAFQDNRNDASDVYFTTSTDGGLTFTPDRKLTKETGTSRQELPSVAIAGDGTQYVAWQDTRQGAEHIMITRADGDVSGVLVEKELAYAVGSLRPSSVKAGEDLTLDLSIPIEGAVRIVIYDMTGRIVAVPFSGVLPNGSHAVPIRLSMIDAGPYFCVVEHAGRSVVRPLIVKD